MRRTSAQTRAQCPLADTASPLPWLVRTQAIGSGTEGAQTALQEEYTDSLTLAEAEVLALKTLKQVMEEKVTPTNVDIAVVNPTYKLYSTDEVKGVIERL